MPSFVVKIDVTWQWIWLHYILDGVVAADTELVFLRELKSSEDLAARVDYIILWVIRTGDHCEDWLAWLYSDSELNFTFWGSIKVV